MSDQQQREQALNPRQSFIVQAPAGSGKTEILIQRFLMLLANVNHPEEILAITFTKKSAAEMRLRILTALNNAKNNIEPTSLHAKKTFSLAKQALAQDQIKKWNLLTNPNQLRIQTIDAFNVFLTKQLPILSHFGAAPDITDDAHSLYRESVQEFLTYLEEDVPWANAIAQLLMHMDNNLNQLEELLINMLAKRDQWLPYIALNANNPELRKILEKHLTSMTQDAVTHALSLFPQELLSELKTLARFSASQLQRSDYDWLELVDLLLTDKCEWRKRFDKNLGFPAASSTKNAEEKSLFTTMKQRMDELVLLLSSKEDLRIALVEIKLAPASYYQENQWQTLEALHQALRIVAAQLKVIFQKHGKIDYIENAQAAITALGNDENPTDLALALDYQLKHILIDEFQDTSNSQYRLIEKLTMGWQPHDDRTLFIVGDPMQSIYRFREAEVGLFLRARISGIGQIKLISLVLSVNFRSLPNIVAWINQHFSQLFPQTENIMTGAIPYHASSSGQDQDAALPAVQLHALLNAQAEAIINTILLAKQNNPEGSIAILVRSRSHLKQIIPALRAANILFRAIDIEPLATRQVIQDLLALTRALLHPADRVAWLAVLRAPWCGLTLADLLLLCGNNFNNIAKQLHNNEIIEQLSLDGKQRLLRIRSTLLQSAAMRCRHSLRYQVEHTWLALGGPAAIEQESDLDDALAYFDLLDTIDNITIEKLTEQVDKLYATPNHLADNTLQIMTIHNAKGLEFDTVILPHLERLPSKDDKQLMLWMEQTRENANNALIIAPVHAIGEENDSIYEYIKRQHAIKTNYETTRLLYVAATRVKKALHLFFTATNSPDSRSLLGKLWPAIRHEVTLPNEIDSDMTAETPKIPSYIKRLNLAWQHPLPHYFQPDAPAYHQQSSGFLLPDNQAKYTGTLIHQILQQLCEQGIEWWQSKTAALQQTYIHSHLLHLGITQNQLMTAATLVEKSINNTLTDSKGLWIIKPHLEARCELSLTAIIDNQMKTVILDRTFIDEDGYRWIIDYKTTDFADKEQHIEQLQLYAEVMKKTEDRPIKLGLYFPLAAKWWEFLFDTSVVV